MPPPDHRRADRLIRFGYWVFLVLLAFGAARALLRVFRGWGWL